MSTIIVRNLDEQTHDRLKREAKALGVSVNTLMQEFIRNGLRSRRAQGASGRYHDLDALAGTWSAREEREFFEHIRPLSEIDEELWR